VTAPLHLRVADPYLPHFPQVHGRKAFYPSTDSSAGWPLSLLFRWSPVGTLRWLHECSPPQDFATIKHSVSGSQTPDVLEQHKAKRARPSTGGAGSTWAKQE